ncbi:MAG: TetR/AcrR family transcriptional regulator [Hyphomonadaceae bacterium]
MARNYTLKRRAEAQAETRQRIVDAAIDLHSSLGPAKTTISMIAEKAGVQRHTLYAHFPDERSMLMACSGHSLERDPLPDARAWRAHAEAEQRLRAGLSAIYDWYARNEGLVACVLRDAETHDLVREIIALRFGPATEAWRDVLGLGLKPKQRGMLALALSFHTWRTLAREAGLKQIDAVKAMVTAVLG